MVLNLLLLIFFLSSMMVCSFPPLYLPTSSHFYAFDSICNLSSLIHHGMKRQSTNERIAEVKADLKSEIITLLGLVMPLVNSLTGFAFGVVGTLTNSNGSEIKNSVDGLVNAATLLVSPVGPVLDALL